MIIASDPQHTHTWNWWYIAREWAKMYSRYRPCPFAVDVFVMADTHNRKISFVWFDARQHTHTHTYMLGSYVLYTDVLCDTDTLCGSLPFSSHCVYVCVCRTQWLNSNSVGRTALTYPMHAQTFLFVCIKDIQGAMRIVDILQMCWILRYITFDQNKYIEWILKPKNLSNYVYIFRYNFF